VRRTKIAFMACAIGSLIAAFMMYAAWQHNPQCEFHCEGAVNWWHWLSVGASWFVACSFAAFVVGLSVRKLASKLVSNGNT